MRSRLFLHTYATKTNKKITQNKKEKQTRGCPPPSPQFGPHKSREGQVNERGARLRGDR